MRRLSVLLPLLALVVASCGIPADSADTVRGAQPDGSGGLLTEANFTIKSILEIDLDQHTATFPLHKGVGPDGVTPVWFIITEASDFGIAHDLNVNFAPKLVNMAVGCPQCVQQTTLTTSPGNRFAEAVVNFPGIPDFSPMRVLKPGPTGFPPLGAQPGAVGDDLYSPFIKLEGSEVVYNAPIVAVGDGPFDVTTHTDTSDRVMAITAEPTKMTVELLIIRGFDSGEEILYISTEASDPVAAVLERATFVPLLNHAPFLGGDDFLGSARERIFLFTNGQTGADNPESQGLAHLILDGHAAEDANLDNVELIAALRDHGDALNIQGDFPSLANPRFANAYSPLWDAQVGEWTPEATESGLNTRQTDENTILQLVVDGAVTGPGGSTFGAGGFVINCPVLGFIDQAPESPQAADPFAALP
jgi:hypothetical protein